MKIKNYLLLFALTIFTSQWIKAQNGVTSIATPFTSGGTHRWILDIKVDHSGKVWIGSYRKGLAVYNQGTQNWNVYDTTNSNIPSMKVLSVANDSSNNIWIATDHGVAKFDGTNFINYNTANSIFTTDTIKQITTFGNELWAATYNGAFHFNNGTWTSVNISNSGLTNDSINCIDVDIQGRVWFATKAGLSCFDNGNWTTYQSPGFYYGRKEILYVKAGLNSVWIQVYNFGNFELISGAFKSANDYIASVFQPTTIYSNICLNGNSTYLFPIGKFYEIINGQLNIYNLSYQGINRTFSKCDFDSLGFIWLVRTYLGQGDSIYVFDKSQYIAPVVTTCNFCIDDDNSKLLDVNHSRCAIINNGSLHSLSNTDYALYSVPKESGLSPVFASALWLGGLDQNNNLHLAAQTYRQTGNDFWPGPLDTITATTDSSIYIQYDKEWKINKWQVDEFNYNFSIGNVQNGTYIVPSDFVTWPAQGTGNITRNLAPFFDYNADGVYNPYDGDYPVIKGDQEIYWIMNDNFSTHGETGGTPLGVEIHAYAYALQCDSVGNDSAIGNYTTFYHYDIINRSTNSYHNMYSGVWSDMDLGKATDDYVGCDSTLNIAFTYNGDNDDDGAGGYGTNPPMMNVEVLKGPAPLPNDSIDNDHDGTIDEAGETNMMSDFMYYNNVNNSPYGNPSGANDHYNLLRSTWYDGTHLTYGFNGTNTSQPITNYMFSGTPYAGLQWSETDMQNTPEDRRFVLSSGPFNLDAGATQTFDFAFVYTRDKYNPNGISTSWAKNVEEVKRVKYWFDHDTLSICDAQVYAASVNEISSANSFSVYPNPATDELYFKTNNDLQKAKYQIIDVTGRLLLSGNTSKQTVDVSKLPDGIYFIKLQSEKTNLVQRFIKE
ncbi:MAG: T9SS type A sorting domain-containing protein [Bacteroidia bacterium]